MKPNEAETILLTVREAVIKLLDDIPDESYINYILFRYTGHVLLDELGQTEFNKIIKEIKKDKTL